MFSVRSTMMISEFSRLFTTFQRTAFRLELRSHYDVPSEEVEFARFVTGEKEPRQQNREWSELVAKAVSLGKEMTRVRVLPEITTPYIQFETQWCYPYSIRAGERIVFLQETVLYSLIKEPIEDFWLFDDTVLVLMRYDSAGRFLGPEVRSSDVEVRAYRLLRDRLLACIERE